MKKDKLDFLWPQGIRLSPSGPKGDYPNFDWAFSGSLNTGIFWAITWEHKMQHGSIQSEGDIC